MTADSYEQSPFLDHRIVRADDETLSIHQISSLLKLIPEIPASNTILLIMPLLLYALPDV
jgi:hypothetical protein